MGQDGARALRKAAGEPSAWFGRASVSARSRRSDGGGWLERPTNASSTRSRPEDAAAWGVLRRPREADAYPVVPW